MGHSISMQIGSLLGARRPGRARLAAALSIAVITPFTGLLCIALVKGRKMFSLDPSVQAAFEDSALVSASAVLLGALQFVLSGILRGTGYQGSTAAVQMTTSWGIVLLASFVLTFHCNMSMYGLLISCVLGYSASCSVLAILVYMLDFEAEAMEISFAQQQQQQQQQQHEVVERSTTSSGLLKPI